MAAVSEWPWQRWARETPDRLALSVDGGAYSWAQLDGRLTAMAAGFRRQGVQSGCGVALKARNSELALLTYLALLRCGARLLPLNPQLPPCQTEALLPSLDIDFTLTLDGKAYDAVPALNIAPQAGAVRHDFRPEAIATLTLTSGSTGLPKAAAHTFDAHLASAHGVVTKLGFSADDSWLLSLPLYHVSGQGILWRWLYSGGRLVFSQNQAALADCSFASLVPTQLWRLLRQPALRLRTVLLGGAAIPSELTAQAEARGIACWCGYGMTETASTVAAKRADGLPGVGQPLSGNCIRLVNGEIALRSEALASGYWRDGELLPLTDKDGWFYTRDGGIQEDKNLLISGRLDNLFFSAGEGIQPEQVEAVLAQHPDVEQVFIVPQQDEEYGQRPVAVAQLRPAASLIELQRWAASRLAGFQRPVCWYPLPPLADGGIKISRKKLAEWVADRQKNKAAFRKGGPDGCRTQACGGLSRQPE